MEDRSKRGRYDHGYGYNQVPYDHGRHGYDHGRHGYDHDRHGYDHGRRGYHSEYQHEQHMYNHNTQGQHHVMDQHPYQGSHFEPRLQINPNFNVQYEAHCDRSRQGYKRSHQTMTEGEGLDVRNSLKRTHLPCSAPRMPDNMQVPQRNKAMCNVPGVTSHGPYSYSGQRTADVTKKGKSWIRPLTTVDTLPYPAEGVEVVYTNDPADAESWLKNNIIDPSADAVGLDIEWKPQFVSKKNGGTENKTAVVQLAVEDSSLVLHLFHLKSFPKSLSDVLADRNVLKVGSGIKGDVIKLIKDTGMLCDGRIDTQDYAKALGIFQGVGLKKLSKQVLNIDLDKPKKISLSNWESFPLRRDQIKYAALDAWISLKLYIELREQLAKKNESASKPEKIQVGVDKPEMPQIYKCQKCSKIFESKKRFSRHKLRCVIVKTGQTSVCVDGNKQQNNKPSDEQTRYDTLNANQFGSSNPNPQTHMYQRRSVAAHSLDEADIDNISSLTEDSSGHDLRTICPVLECRMKCQGQNDLMEHVRVSKHACCKECGKIFRSKVSASHKRQHATQKHDVV